MSRLTFALADAILPISNHTISEYVLGITGQLFTDPANSNRVGLILNVPDMEAFQKVMQSEEGADAMRFDGVRAETLLILEQASDHL